MGKALFVVDAQNDFSETGSLPVPGGMAVAAKIKTYIDAHRGDYDVVLASADFHINPGEHFSTTPDFATTWPVHCVAGTPGAEFITPLSRADFAHVFYKGMNAAAYSAFEGVADIDDPDTDPASVHPDDPSAKYSSLENFLRDKGIDTLDVCGIEWRNCVRATAQDGAALGFVVHVAPGLCAYLPGDDLIAGARAEMTSSGVTFVEL